MISLDFDWQTNEFMLYCRTTQLREKSMMAYEQTLRLFERFAICGYFSIGWSGAMSSNALRRSDWGRP